MPRVRAVPLLVSILLAGCAAPRAAPSPVVCSLVLPGLAEFSPLARGAKVAVDELAASRPGGRPPLAMRLYEIDESDVDTLNRVIRECRADPDVVAVIALFSDFRVQVIETALRGRLPLIAVVHHMPRVRDGNGSATFEMMPDEGATGETLARLARRRGWRRAVSFYEAVSPGPEFAESFRVAFPGEVVHADPVYPVRIWRGVPYAQADTVVRILDPYLAAVPAARPDVLFIAWNHTRTSLLMGELVRRDLGVPVILSTLNLARVEADSMLPRELYVVSPFDPGRTEPGVQRFVERYRTAYGRPPDADAALAYDAVRLVAEVVDRSGPDRESLRRALGALTPRTAPRGVTGGVLFTPDGHRLGSNPALLRLGPGVSERLQ